MSNKIDIVGILEILPHRYPFLLIDSILDINLDANTIVGVKNVSINEPFFQGHFPDNPIMPGVLIVEAIAQVGGVFLYKKGYRETNVLASIKNAKFRKIVRPGDVLHLEARAIHISIRAGKMKGQAKVDGKIVAEVEMIFGILRKGDK